MLLPLLAAAGCAMPAARGDVTLPAIISDNMVLQQHTGVNVWGKADPGESVTVQLGPESAQTIAGKDGAWGVKMDGLRYGGPYDMVVSGKNSVTVRNVAVGEVWLCSGESNMEYKLIAARNGQEEMADADLPMVRIFQVKHQVAQAPQAGCEGAWTVCDPAVAGDFPAIGFFFARELNRSMRVPIGLIQSAWGPSPIAAWMPQAALEKNPDLHAVLDRYRKAVADYPALKAAYDASLAQWQGSGGGTPKPVPPLEPGGQRQPAALYNGMIAPLVRYPVRGVLWYQGESDTGEPALYRKLFPAMLGAWRSAWAQPEMPFLYAQLSGFLKPRPAPEESAWAELREAQTMALSVPKTGQAVTVDVAEPNQMHPADKQDVAHRLALLAESAVYGQEDVAASGPIFSGMEVQGSRAVLSFQHAGGGLAGGEGGVLKGFEIAGPDRAFVWADARIDGEQVIVQSKQAPAPVAVRYAWADYPDASLFNKAGLPASPFRTDDWVAGQAPAAAPSPSASPSPTPRKHHRHHPATE
jgi:sialate O-acetylesterase